jgi:hypothetical protein
MMNLYIPFEHMGVMQHSGGSNCTGCGDCRAEPAPEIELLPIDVLEARIRAEKSIAADTPVPPDAPGSWGGDGVVVCCTCSPFGPTAASGHMQSCPLYTKPAVYQVLTTTAPFTTCTALVNDTIVCGRPI